MPNEEILKYIKDSLSQNYTRDQIWKALLQVGWGNEQVEEAFRSVQSSSGGTPAQPQGFSAMSSNYVPEQSRTQSATPRSMFPMAIIAGVVLVAVGIGITFWALTKKDTTPSLLPAEQALFSGATTTAVLSTTATCGTEDCFRQKFASCELASFQTTVQGFGAAAYYEIIGPKPDGCEMTFKYPTNPNPKWVDQPMTCTFDNKIEFRTSVANTFTQATNGSAKCTGPLYDILRSIASSPSIKTSTAIEQTPTSKIVISDLNYTTVSVSELSKYTKNPLTFKVANVELAKYECETESFLDSLGGQVFENHTICNPYYSKEKNTYSDPVYFSNYAAGILGSYNTRNGKSYFENEGVDHIIVEFYLTDADKKESNHLKLTFTK